MEPPCEECGADTTNCHIYIMQNLTSDEELTICEHCRQYYNWKGWIDDQELEDLANSSLAAIAI